MTRRSGPRIAGALVGCTLLLASCGAPRPGISNGSVSACYRAIPTARAAVRNHHARLSSVHRVPAEEVRRRLPASARSVLAADNDATVCAIAFKGTFTSSQVDLAPPNQKGSYALILVDSRHLHLLASVVLNKLPRALGTRTL